MSGNIFEDILMVGVGLAVLPIYGAVKAVQWGLNQTGHSSGLNETNQTTFSTQHYRQEVNQISERSSTPQYNAEQEHRDKQRLLAIQQEAERERKRQERLELERLKKEKELKLKNNKFKGMQNTIETMDFSFLEGRPQWKEVQKARTRYTELIDSTKDIDQKLSEIESIKSEMKRLALLSDKREKKLKERELKLTEDKCEIVQYLNELKNVSVQTWKTEEAKKEKIFRSESIQHIETYKMEVRLMLGKALEEQSLTAYYREKISRFEEDWSSMEKVSPMVERLLRQSKISHKDYQIFYETLSREKLLELAQDSIRHTIDSALEKVGCTVLEDHSENTVYFDTEFGPEYKIARYFEEGKLMLQLTRFMEEEMDEDSYKKQIGSYELKRDENIARKWCKKLDSALYDLKRKLPDEHYRHNVISREEPIQGNSKIAYAYDPRYAPVSNKNVSHKDSLKQKEMTADE